MAKKGARNKRKLEEHIPKKIEEEINEESDVETDDLLNVINNEEDADSSDSDRDIEESDGEVEDVLESATNGNDDDSDVEEEEDDADEEEDDDVNEEEDDIDDEEDDVSSVEDEENEGWTSSENEEEEDKPKNGTSLSETKSKTKSSKNKADGGSVSSLTKLVKNDDNKEDDEYKNDSSDDEDIRNTVGNIPMKWYDEYKHIGYNWDGKKILKPPQGDQLDEFLKKMEDPDFWRTVKDPQTGQDVVLSEQDIELIRRIQARRNPDAQFDEYAPWIEWFTSEVMQMPVRKFPEHKRSFLPSKSEAKKVSKLVHSLKMGWLKTLAEKEKERTKKDAMNFYMLWESDDQAEHMRRIYKHISAPKRALPGHAESYNPPAEYLFNEKEMKLWKKYEETPSKRKLHFLPQKYDSLRKVPSYSRFIKERFLRCLDLYLCPRAIKMRLTIEPEDLVPKLPSPKDLQPFPSVQSIIYEGHSDMVRCISVDKIGQYMVSGSDDTTIKIWEINTGRCVKTIPVEGIVRSVEWCPNTAINLILVAASNRVILINPNIGDYVVCEKTDELLKEAPLSDLIISDKVKTTVQWVDPTEEEYAKGFRLILKHFKEVAQVTWHGKGDYFATVMPEGANKAVLISQLSKRRSQIPLAKPKGLVQCVLFHPTRPMFFVATQRHVRVYDLLKQAMVKKLTTESKWVSKMDIHPGGDNLLVATYDRKVLWFDLDLSTKPYQTLRLHPTAVRAIAYHKRYPLFATGSDDTGVIVSHGMVYNDLLQNALIVPLKRFEEHKRVNDFGVFDVKFHPHQPWVFSSGADSTIRLHCN
ncbi:PREDICTED: ribosome biogenesis protein BOP1 homolog [Nicrophorus vespilloides]|uniref:Ribosome biogenesis protein BOP1 homolog n=1 Tax=Nicrophorus vespilloides TaxID=110193 RepID=A0ABM1MZV5_NICVS|nr:PREDICTED: ribosome biogenesis protein BOP1 homolog [Nicrophorus vespilloides]